MAVALTTVTDRDAESVLTVVESVTYNGKSLAVCEDGTGNQVLARERTRPVALPDGKRPRKDDRGKTRATEPYWKRTAALVDMRDAVLADLIAL